MIAVARPLIALAAGTLCLGLAAVPAAIAGHAALAIRVDGLNRSGRTLSVPAALMSSSGIGYQLAAGQQASVSPGSYLIGAEVPSYAGTELTAETLVVRRVTLASSGTVILNAQPGVPLAVTLRPAGTATPRSLTAMACLSAGGSEVPIAAQTPAGVALYLVPATESGVGFWFLASLLGSIGTPYYLAGSAAGGIPADPSFAFTSGQLAKVTVELRTGIVPAGSWQVTTQPGGLSPCEVGFGQARSASAPAARDEYLSAGRWLTTAAAQSAPDTSYQVSQVYSAGQWYPAVLGGAVTGPRLVYPATSGKAVTFSAASLFSDPGAITTGRACCSQTSLTLSLGKTVLRQVSLTSWSSTSFQATMPRPGWYTLNLSAHRSTGHAGTAGSELSGKLDLRWRFHASLTTPATVWTPVPVTLTVFVPRRLNLANEAAADGSTPLSILVTRPPGGGAYPLTHVSFQASGNDGASWQPLDCVPSGSGRWRTAVPDPASGYVARRSVVTDSHGDSTEETIYQAYAVR